MSQPYCALLLIQTICVTSASALQSIECGANHKCISPLHCNEDDDCVVTCRTVGCKSLPIYCPLRGDCTIQCEGHQACAAAIIYANSSIGNLDLICPATANPDSDVCGGIKVFGSTSSSNAAYHFNIVCETCHAAEIHCAHSTDCQITCNGTMDSCDQIHIHGPQSNELQLQCEGTNACRNAIISASDTSDLFIDGCSDPYANSCINLTVYCPPATDSAHCRFEGDHNFGLVQLYAIGGWNDINIDYFGEYPHVGGTMHCGSDYSISCDIMSHSWSCVDTVCANPTLKPTMSPINDTLTTDSYTANTVIVTVTDKPHAARDGLVQEQTTTIGYVITQYAVRPSMANHTDQDTLITILAILCGALVCIVCILIGWICNCRAKCSKKVTEPQVIIHHVAKASNSNTSTVVTNQTAPSMELSRIPEVIEGSIPGTIHSGDDGVLHSPTCIAVQRALDLNFNPSMHQKHSNILSAISPCSCASNVSEATIIGSVHLDDEVMGSDEEYDAHNYQTPRDHHKEMYLDPLGCAYPRENEPPLERMQSEGGEQYHKLQMIQILAPIHADHDTVTQDGEINEEFEEDNVMIGCETMIGETELVQIPTREEYNDENENST